MANPRAPRSTNKDKLAPGKKLGAGDSERASKPIGAPTLYTPELAAQICDYIAEGKSLRTIAGMPGMPDKRTIQRWLADESKTDFRTQYARAREEQADLLAEEVMAIADEECVVAQHPDDESGAVEVKFDAALVQNKRLRVDARRWYAAKLAPKKYGEKLAVGGADDLPPIATKSLTDAERAVRLVALLAKAEQQ